MLCSTLFRKRGRDLVAAIRALFASSEVGVWYDPSDFSTLYQDSAGTTPVTAVGDPVGKILDKSGRGNHATQSTSTARPTLQQDSGGRYYLAFDGVDDFLVTSAIDFTATDKMSVFAGVRKLSDAARGSVLAHGVDSTANPRFFDISAPDSSAGPTYGCIVSTDSANYTRASVATFASPITNVLSYALSQGSSVNADRAAVRVNGTDRTEVLTSSAGTNVAGAFGSGALYIGMRAGTTLPFNGRLYSLIVRGALSTAAEIAAAESYVNTKTGAY